MNRMGQIHFLYIWIVKRLPVLFSIPFVLCLMILLLLSNSIVDRWEAALIDQIVKLLGLPDFFIHEFRIVRMAVIASLVLLTLFASVLGAYHIAVWLYSTLLRRSPTIEIQEPYTSVSGSGDRLRDANRIGIILAGGGAKGAYQAGAMKAIYEFLEENDALGKVRMIAGTSIGSWNAMFWLADMIKSPNGGEKSAHEKWWRSIHIGRIMEFAHYVPLRKNYFLKTTPWQESFDKFFSDNSAVAQRLERLVGNENERSIHFYFTRSNVERGHLEFTTNWGGLAGRMRPNFRGGTRPLVDPGLYEIATSLRDLKTAVFASMDLPPLFPYMKFSNGMEEWFEDGGVVDNLPVWFGTMVENCDLLFVLPLNATFAEPVDHRLIMKRLFRVMDVRQGVLERNSFRLAHMYNEIAALRQRIQELEGRLASNAGDTRLLPENQQVTKQLVEISKQREHRPVRVFAICPSLVCAQEEMTIGTTEFWKPEAAGRAFDLMYTATKEEIAENFELDTDPTWIRMTVVSPLCERSYVDNF